MRNCLLALAALLPLAAAAQSPVPDGATPQRIAGGFQFTEGPVWYDGGLLFSDIPGDTVYRWTEGGSVEVFLRPSQKSNGLALDAEGRLLLAQHQAQRLARLGDDGVEVSVADTYDGNTFNSPNDLAVHPDGSIYFTDPTWGLEGRPSALGFTGLYRLGPDGTVSLLADDLHQPNGVAFSPDLATLYVTTSDERTVVAYDLADGAVSNGRVFARLTGGMARDAADGMAIDEQGRLYVAGPRGIWVFAPDGTTLDVVDVPGQTTNVTFGPDTTLYITSGPSVYRLALAGATSAEGRADVGGLRVASVYPNPSSGKATVVLTSGEPRRLTLTLTDVLGRTVLTLDLGVRERGEHPVEVNLDGLASGRYVVRVSDGRVDASRVFIVR